MKLRNILSLLLIVVSFAAVAQTSKTIEGVVVDQAGAPLIGVTVVIQNTMLGSVTNQSGEFTIKFGGEKATIQAQMIGFETVVTPALFNQAMKITLNEDVRSLDEVVVIGYGTSRKSDLTGSVSSVTLKDEVTTNAIVSADKFLQGRVAGVNISSNSGAPGDAMTIQIRGTSTLSGSTAPLYVIDGFPIEASAASTAGFTNETSQQPTMNPLASINPNDIESIQILKDASATAIYGSRATNGVVLITTKQGKEGEFKVNYNARIDVSKVSKQYNMLNAHDYALFLNELDRTSGGYNIQGNVIGDGDVPRYSDADLKLYETYSTDWQGLMYTTAISKDHQLGVSGGNKSTRYNITAGYTDQEGVIMNTGLERYSFRANTSSKLGSKLTLNTNVNYSQSKQNQTSHSQPTSLNQMVRRIITTEPILMPGDVIYENDDLEYVGLDNPYIMANELKDVLEQQFLIVNSSLNYDLGGGLSLKGAGSFNRITGDRSTYQPSTTNAGIATNGSAFRGINFRQNIVLETTMNYVKEFNKNHRMNAVLGYTHEDRHSKFLQVATADFAGDDLGFNSIGQGTITSNRNSGEQKTKLSSFISRVNYSMYNRYSFTVTGRYDGSSLLAKGNQWSFFPSVAFAWGIKQEEFLRSVKAISTLKLRLSYGMTGNQSVDFAAPYAIVNHARSYIDGEVAHAMVNGKLANPDLGWERTESYNIGLDAGFIKNRFRFSFDAYHRVTKDMLMNLALPLSSGYNMIAYNAGQITNRGVELEVGANILTGDFKWSVGGNIYLNRNNVDDIGGNKLTGTEYLAGGGVFNSHVHMTMEGHPVGSFYGYVVDGVYQNEAEAKAAPYDTPQATPGSLRYVDISGPDGLPDGKITTDDMTIIGSAQAKFNYGFNTTLSWKKLTLDMLFTGRYGGSVANLNRYFTDSYTDTRDNIRQEAWDGRWQGEGTSNYYPAVNGAQSGSYLNKRFSTFLLEDASYFRLNNISLTYNINIKKIKWVKAMKVFASASNVFTISGYSGYDPEVSITRGALSPNVDYAAYPSSRTYSAGLNLTF